jgi:hypothetical protein
VEEHIPTPVLLDDDDRAVARKDPCGQAESDRGGPLAGGGEKYRRRGVEPSGMKVTFPDSKRAEAETFRRLDEPQQFIGATLPRRADDVRSRLDDQERSQLHRNSFVSLG